MSEPRPLPCPAATCFCNCHDDGDYCCEACGGGPVQGDEP